jgi:hypothetical protein
MPAAIASLRFPYDRVLLQRTKLAYVHLTHLLSDAKRDRAARVFGYVAIWLPEELVILYLQEGEVVNATRTGVEGSAALPIGEAHALLPEEPELGEICFHECADEQLACMFQTLTQPEEPWPAELDPVDPDVLFPYLMSTTFDGTVEIKHGGLVNYLILRDGAVERAFVWGRIAPTPEDAIGRLFNDDARRVNMAVRRWPISPVLPVQASPLLIRAYREVAINLVKRLVQVGQESAPQIAEQARRRLIAAHPALDHFTVGERPVRDPVADADEVTAAVAAWLAELMWAGLDQGAQSPEEVLRDITRDRRHMFQSAGFFDRLPWTVEW